MALGVVIFSIIVPFMDCYRYLSAKKPPQALKFNKRACLYWYYSVQCPGFLDRITGGDWIRPDEVRIKWRVQDDSWPG